MLSQLFNVRKQCIRPAAPSIEDQPLKQLSLKAIELPHADQTYRRQVITLIVRLIVVIIIVIIITR